MSRLATGITSVAHGIHSMRNIISSMSNKMFQLFQSEVTQHMAEHRPSKISVSVNNYLRANGVCTCVSASFTDVSLGEWIYLSPGVSPTTNHDKTAPFSGTSSDVISSFVFCFRTVLSHNIFYPHDY